MMSRILEAVSQFKISTKRSPNEALYRKISIQFRKISNYGTSSLLRGGTAGALLMFAIVPCKRTNPQTIIW